MAKTRHGGQWSMEDKCESPWHYLPIEVPPGSSALTVEFSYDTPGAGLDLGCFSPVGFRGRSGAPRPPLLLTPHSPTPAYLPSVPDPLPPHTPTPPPPPPPPPPIP